MISSGQVNQKYTRIFVLIICFLFIIGVPGLSVFGAEFESGQSIINLKGNDEQFLNEVGGDFVYYFPIVFYPGPSLTITGMTADGDPMAGDLATGYILETTKIPSRDHLIQFSEGSKANEPLADKYFGLYLVDSTVNIEDLKAYYVGHGTPSVPIDFLGYLQDAVDGINPFVYIKDNPLRLVDAAKWNLLGEEHDMTVPDDFPPGIYTVKGQIEDETGLTATVTLILKVEVDEESLTFATLESVNEYFINLGIVYNKYQMSHMSTQISLADTNLESLWVKKPGVSYFSSVPLISDPLLWFNIESPAGTYEYVALTQAGDIYTASLAWPGHQNGTFESTGEFELAVNERWYQEFELFDSGGDPVSFAGADTWIAVFKVSSNWQEIGGPQEGSTLWWPLDAPTGQYYFMLVRKSDNVVFKATLDFEYIFEITEVELQQSMDEVAWTPISGTLADVYEMILDGTENFHYLDINKLTASGPVDEGTLHPFYLDTSDLPTGFNDYWAAKGVDQTADPLSWQGQMYLIITGDQPMFYLNKTGDDYTLVDGLQYALDQGLQTLRINGDYPLGDYTFTGTVLDEIGSTYEMAVNITFALIE